MMMIVTQRVYEERICHDWLGKDEVFDMSNSDPVKVPMIPGCKLDKDEQGEK